MYVKRLLTPPEAAACALKELVPVKIDHHLKNTCVKYPSQWYNFFLNQVKENVHMQSRKKNNSEVHVYIYETTIHPLNFGRSPDQVMSISPIEVTKILRVMSVTQI